MVPVIFWEFLNDKIIPEFEVMLSQLLSGSGDHVMFECSPVSSCDDAGHEHLVVLLSQ